MNDAWRRPDPSEHNPYYGTYVAKVPDGDVFETLERQIAETRRLLAPVAEERERYRYADGKWTLREVIGHLIDTERAFAHRALWMARNAGVPLPSFEQDAWVDESNAADRVLADLLEEWDAVRRSTLLMFRGLDPATAERVGVASGFDFTVRSFAWIIAGHELHHRALIEEHYLPDGP